MTRRVERVNVLLRHEISRVLAIELRDPRLSSIVSVTRVEASSDLHIAKVFISVLGNQEDKSNTLRALKSASNFVRRSIRPHVALKTVPAIDFYVDDSIERGAEVLKLINEVAAEPKAGQTP